jgi:membrane-bound lytic murein transglycosylase MltF
MRRFNATLVLLLPLLAVREAGALQTKPAPAPERPAGKLDDRIVSKKFTGDFDEMLKRRQLRVLVPYSKTLYFIDKGQQRGLAYDAFKLFEDDYNKKRPKGTLPFHVVFVPISRGDMGQALLEGRGDVAMGYLTITPERRALVDFSNPTARNVSQIVVTAPGQPPLSSKEDLSGREVYVRKGSIYYDSVVALNAELQKSGKPPVKIREAPTNLENEDVLEMVNAGLVDATVVDDFYAKFWKQVFTKMQLNEQAALRTGGEMAWAIRKNSPLLKKALDDFLARYPEGSSARNQLLAKYLKSTKYVKNSVSAEERAKFERVVELFRKYCKEYDMDTLLMAAQGYQESRLDQNAKSHVGAVGVMQVMPATGAELKVGDIHEMDPNIHAGVKYVRFMMDKYYGNEPMTPLDKGLFTFAAYNAGPGRIAQLRKIAKQRGLDPNVWFNNVELIASEKIGRETVTYVSNIYKYYLAYQLATEQVKEREEAKKTVETATPK